jgi:16S rRNA (adenine1518-N6/adenine1519-N6)-dimethyltransferase
MINDIDINYNSPSALRIFLEKEGIGMRKKYGQNFLINPQIRTALVDALGVQSGDEVWEIGPGIGAMTALLLKRKIKVKAFEIDIGFIRILKNLFSGEEGFSLIEGDVLKTWHTQEPAPFLLGNLPYNIAAVLLADFIEKRNIFSRMVITVQKEVALRMAAPAGSQDYSSFSVLFASAYKVKPLMTISPSSFYPQPNVDSMGVLLEKQEKYDPPAIFYSLVRSLFASRRKTVKNNLLTFLSSGKGFAKRGKTDIQELCNVILKENSLLGNERAENFEIEVFLSLAKTIENMQLLK